VRPQALLGLAGDSGQVDRLTLGARATGEAAAPDHLREAVAAEHDPGVGEQRGEQVDADRGLRAGPWPIVAARDRTVRAV
jgi:hypothetical protein